MSRPDDEQYPAIGRSESERGTAAESRAGDGSGREHSGGAEEVPRELVDAVDRAFTCTICGYETMHEVAPLRTRVGATCANCSDWTIQTADDDELVAAAEAAADVLAGDVITERQALAYLVRDVVGLSRQSAAHVLDSSPSNVDNLQRKGREKVEEARRVVAGVDALAPGRETTPMDGADD